MNVDFGKTTRDYTMYRAPFPESLYDRLSHWGIGAEGQMIVDFGTGTGSLARAFARRGCRVTGLDVSQEMLREAARLASQENLQIEFKKGPAEASGLPDGSADIVVSGQCWHWFDGAAAAREANRLLKDGGQVVIAHFDWLPIGQNVVTATEALIQAHNPRWAQAGGSGLYPRWLRDLAESGFQNLESFSYDLTVPYSHEAWRGRIRASAGVGASLPPAAVSEFDAALSRLLVDRFPQEVLQIPHRIFAVIGRRSSGEGRS